MSELIAWLRAQLDEDERVALAAQSVDGGVFDGAGIVVMRAATGTRSVTLTSVVARHIARHDPARVLAEVAAKRAIVDQHTVTATSEVFGEVSTVTYCPICRNDGQCMTLWLLAQPYAERPGYREEWRP